MSKKKKRNKKDREYKKALESIILVTAVLNLIAAIVELLKTVS